MRDKNFSLKFVLLVGDIFLMYLALLLALAVRYGDFSFWPGPQTRVFLYHFSFISLFWLLFLFILDFYEIPPLKKVFEFFSNLIIFLLLAGAFGVAYFYLRPQPIIAPKTILILDLSIFSFFLCGWRYVFSRILKLQNFKEKIVLIGSLVEFKDLSSDLLNQNGYEMVASFDPNSSLDVSKLKEIIEKEKVNSVVFALNSQRNEDLVKQIFSNLPLKLNFISFPSFYESVAKKVPLEAIDEFWFLENLSRSEKRIDEILKRGFDIIFSFFGLIIVFPILGVIAVLIKISSPGPVFYKGERVGRYGKLFKIYKFRTMISDAEKAGIWSTSVNDPRLTKIGKFLKKYQIDELPQLINVLKGEMSLVGPRPQVPWAVELYNEEEKTLLNLQPGMTDWASLWNFHEGEILKGSKDADKDYLEKIHPEKMRLALEYARHHSFWIDLKIILKTIIAIFFR